MEELFDLFIYEQEDMFSSSTHNHSWFKIKYLNITKVEEKI